MLNLNKAPTIDKNITVRRTIIYVLFVLFKDYFRGILVRKYVHLQI